MRTSSTTTRWRACHTRFSALSVQYQPIHSLDAHASVVGCEALVRPAARALIEGTSDLTAWVLDRAEADGLPVDMLAVNVEPYDLDERPVLAALEAAAATQHHRLIVEVTERGPIPSAAALRSLRSTGVTVALDDVSPARFWTAIEAEPDIVKLELTPWRSHLRSAIDACHSRGIEVIVERVETRADAEFVQRCGATLAQGYFWSASMEPSALRSYALRTLQTA